MKNNIRDWSNMAENTRKFEGMKEEKEKEKKYINDANEITFMGNQEITADFETLLRQAKYTAEEYFVYSKSILEDHKLKYTCADVIELTKIMSSDFYMSVMAIKIQEIRDVLMDIVNTIEEFKHVDSNIEE